MIDAAGARRVKTHPGSLRVGHGEPPRIPPRRSQKPLPECADALLAMDVCGSFEGLHGPPDLGGGSPRG